MNKKTGGESPLPFRYLRRADLGVQRHFGLRIKQVHVVHVDSQIDGLANPGVCAGVNPGDK